MKAVKPGGWGPYDTPRSTELAEIDEKLATYGLDNTGTDTVTGTIIAQQTWTTTGGSQTIQITGANARVITTLLATSTSAAGTMILGDNDYFLYSPATTRTVMISPLEGDNNYNADDRWVVDDTNLTGSGNTYGLQSQSAGTLTFLSIPIPKPHDGATITSVVGYFKVPRGILGAPLPAAFPGVNLLRTTIATNAVTTVAAAAFASPGTSSAYYNGGNPNMVTMTPGSNNVMDLSQYIFSLQAINDTSVDIANHVVWTGFAVTYSNIVDNRFPQ